MTSNVKKFRITVFCLSLLFALTTLIGVLSAPLGALAADYASDKATSTLKFKQFAAGEDFAIALTYDGDLYAWSLLNKKETTGSGTYPNGNNEYGFNATPESCTSLGMYYPSTPIKVNVDFAAVLYNSMGVASATGLTQYAVNGTDLPIECGKVNNYVGGVDDKILQIAATRTTAAVLTEEGLIYTWGVEPYEPHASDSTYKTAQLLLHGTTSTGNNDSYKSYPKNRFIPSLIDYSGRPNMELLPIANRTDYTPAGGADGKKAMISKIRSITASENNYAVCYVLGNSTEQTYVWGEQAYWNLVGSGEHFKIPAIGSNIQYGGQHISEGFYLGDGAIYYLWNDKLFMRGKNYSVHDNFNIINTVDFSSGTYDGYTADSIDNSLPQVAGESGWRKIPKAVTNGFQEVGTVGTSRAKLSVNLWDSDVNYVNKTGDKWIEDNRAAQITLEPFSAGAGYGYMLYPGGVYFWGDNSLGQDGKGSATTASSLGFSSVFTGSYRQVVAGKILSGKSIFEAYLYENETPGGELFRKAEGIADKWESAGSLKSDYVDGDTQISALLSSEGAVSAFGAINGVRFASISLTDVLKTKGLMTSGGNTPAALFSGYGNNLFVLSTLGKLYRVQGVESNGTVSFTCELYDEFTAGTATNTDRNVYRNWDVATDSSAVTQVEFLKYYNAEEGRPYNVSAEIGLTQTKVTAGTDENVRIESRPVVTVNNAGDAFRMILPYGQAKIYDGLRISGIDADESNITVQEPTEKLKAIVGQTPQSLGDLEFYWKGYDTPIPAEVAFRYFGIQYMYSTPTNEDDAPQIAFAVTPKRSTAGHSIVIKYWVGRYDTVANFKKPSDVGVGDSYVFYDFKQALVEIKINDAPFAVVYESQRAAEDTNSTIPLLDPNNPFNNTYSLAVMNVSAGFVAVQNELDAFFAAYNVQHSSAQITAFNKTAAYNALIANILSVDSGFPAISKITDGSLLYYNPNAAVEYNNAYKYMASDYDGDIVHFVEQQPVLSVNGYNEFFTYQVRTVSAFMPLGLTSVQFDLVKDDLRDLFEQTERNGEVLRFDNTYGLTMTVTDPVMSDDDATQIVACGVTFSYEVLTITAVKSMYSGSVSYEDDNIQKAVTKVAPGTMAAVNMLRPRLTDGSNVVTLENTSAAHRAVEVFTQSSLTFRERTSGNTPVSAHTIYGAPENARDSGKTNEYEYKNISLTLAVSGVGENKGAYTVDLKEFFVDASNIRIAFEGNVSASARTKWVKTFGAGNALEITNITATSFTARARRKIADGYKFTLELRRVQPASGASAVSENTFSYSQSPTGAADITAERVFVHFNITVAFIESSYFSVKSNPEPQKTVHADTTVNIFGRLNITPAILTEFADKIDVNSSNTSVVEAEPSADNCGIDLHPRSSGKAIISYTVHLFDYDLTDSFEVQVATLSAMSKTEKVLDETKVYLNDLKNYVSRVNDLKNVTLSLKDTTGDEKPYYFQQHEIAFAAEDTEEIRKSKTDAALKTNDIELAWSDVVDAEGKTLPWPSFLDNVYIDSYEQAYIGFKMGTYSSYNGAGESDYIYRVVVLFEGSDGQTYEVSFRVAPASQQLLDTDGIRNDVLQVQINKADGTIAILNRAHDGVEEATAAHLLNNEDGTFGIPLKFLTDYMRGTDPSDTYEVIAVQAQSADGLESFNKYLKVSPNSTQSANGILITPLYPSDELASGYCNVQVSVRETKSNAITLLHFRVSITGIKTTLTKTEYRNIILIVFFCVLAVLIVIFFIRMGVYWKKIADQRKIIKKNQTLIKMRDKMHQKTEAVSKEQVVRTKLKMEDPKYARMFNEMRQNKEAQTGIVLENSLVAQKAENKEKANKEAKKKKKGKQSLADLQAELAAKREAVARMQAGDFTAAPEGVMLASDAPPVSVPAESFAMDGEISAADAELNAVPAEPMQDAPGEEITVFEPTTDTNDGGNMN